MKRHIRHILFSVFVLLFLIIGSYLILIAQGFTVDFKNLRVEKTGAIFLKFNPRNAVLSINEEETEHTQKGLLSSGGLIVKNLIPGFYDLKISKEGYYDWTKTLEVRSGLITSESHIRLWPKKFPGEMPLGENVEDFWLTGKGVVYKNKNSGIIFEDTALKGDTVFLSELESKLLVTKSGEDYFLIDLEKPRSAVNLTHLFNSLKQRQLNLPGVVPVTGVFFHSFSPNKILVTSWTSLYAIDVKKIEIEKLVTLENIKLARTGANDAFVTDDKGNLTTINLLLKTVIGEPIELGEVKDFRVDSEGTDIYALTSEGELKIYNRSSGKIETIAQKVEDFEISPEGKRMIITTADGLKIFYIKKFEEDLKYEAGTLMEIPNTTAEIKELVWLANFPNYIAFLKDGVLIFQETDSREPTNSNPLLEGIRKYGVRDKKLYLLKENGELIVFSIAEDV